MNQRILILIGIVGVVFSSLMPARAQTAPDATTSNAPGILVDGTSVAVFVPFASDNHLRGGTEMAVIESLSDPLPTPIFFHSGFTDSCASSQSSGETICAGLFGHSFIINPDLADLAATRRRVTGFGTGVGRRVHFTGGDCANCGVAIDDGLGTAIISTGKGYLPMQLSPRRRMPLITTNGESVSGQFGYDPVNHRILSPNYQVLDIRHFRTGPPHFQIIDPTNRSATGADGGAAIGSTVFDLANDQAFFINGNTCNGGSDGLLNRDALPDSAALDTVTNIAYVTFRSRANCNGANTVEDVALFDLSQATFTSGSPTGTWDTPGKQIETLSELQADFENGVTGIAVASAQHLAVIADRFEGSGGVGFGAMRLPSTSGSGTPALVDWVQANMPNDPSGAAWQMSFMPNGVAAYTSPNSGRAMGVVMNEARTFVAVVDLESLLDAARASGTSHTISPSVDLVGTGIVRFVDLRTH